MIEFSWLYVFAALPLPLLVILLSRRQRQPPASALRVPFYAVLQDTPPAAVRQSWRWLPALLVWLLLVTAAARPQWVGEPVQLPQSGRNLLLAVDISRSMEEQDMLLASQPSTRLRAVQAVAGEFLNRRVGDRVGLILFGSRAYVQTPLTFDRATVRGLLFEAETRLAGNATAIGDAIGLAVKKLRDQPEDQRVLILMTDGANTAGEVDPRKAAELAAQEKVRIYTIGVGADEMLVRDFFGVRRYNPSADLDEAMLTELAQMTGGSYFRARDTEGLENIYWMLDQLEPLASTEETFRPVRELYIWPLAAALVLSGLAALAALPWRRRREETAHARTPG